MSSDDSGDWSNLTVEEGFDKLVNSVDHLQRWISEHAVSEASELADDDRFLHPIHSTVRQTIVQLLLSSLDHLRLVGTSLGAQSRPNPFAQSTLIRTAITGASTALWMLSEDFSERRYRALEFHFKDSESHRQFIKNGLKQRPLPEDERGKVEVLDAELRRRQEWIIEQARILRPEDNATFDRFSRTATSDTAIVRAAGAAIGVQGRVSEDWNSTALLMKTWQALSAYARCRPWATLFDRQITGEPDEISGLVTVTQTGSSDRLLDQPVIDGGACPWNLDCHNCDKFVLSGADLLYWRRKREQWQRLAEGAPDDATAEYLHRYFEPTARAIDGKSTGRPRATGSGARLGPAQTTRLLPPSVDDRVPRHRPCRQHRPRRNRRPRRRRTGSMRMSEPARSAPRTAAALAARHRDTRAALGRVRDTIARLRREKAPVNVAAVARRAGVSRTFLYTNPDAKTAVAKAIREARDQRRRLLVEADASREATWRERALNAEDALKTAHAEIRAQRSRIGELLGRIRDREAEWTQDAVQRITAENTTLKQRVRQLTTDNRTLDDRLKAARSNLRFQDRRIADLETQLADPRTVS